MTISICKLDQCTRKKRARGLCAYHYYIHREAGTVELVGDESLDKTKHIISDPVADSRRGFCQICGPNTRIYSNTLAGGNQRWSCSEKGRSLRVKYPKYFYDGEKFIDPAFAESERQRLTISQQGKCAICPKTETDTDRLRLDHCHTTGKIRGLLCNDCNLGLGYFRDSPHNLQVASRYLTTEMDTDQPSG